MHNPENVCVNPSHGMISEVVICLCAMIDFTIISSHYYFLSDVSFPSRFQGTRLVSLKSNKYLDVAFQALVPDRVPTWAAALFVRSSIPRCTSHVTASVTKGHKGTMILSMYARLRRSLIPCSWPIEGQCWISELTMVNWWFQVYISKIYIFLNVQKQLVYFSTVCLLWCRE